MVGDSAFVHAGELQSRHDWQASLLYHGAGRCAGRFRDLEDVRSRKVGCYSGWLALERRGLGGYHLLDRAPGAGINVSVLVRLKQSLLQSLHVVSQSLRSPGIYLLLLSSIAVWSMAYQYKTAYVVDVGGPGDDAYVFDFNSKEHNPELNYR